MGQPGLGSPGRASHWGQEQSRTGRRWRRGGHGHPEPGLGAVLVPTATYYVSEQIQGSKLAGLSSAHPGQQDQAREAASRGPIFSLCLWLRNLVASPCPCPRAACTPLPPQSRLGHCGITDRETVAQGGEGPPCPGRGSPQPTPRAQRGQGGGLICPAEAVWPQALAGDQQTQLLAHTTTDLQFDLRQALSCLGLSFPNYEPRRLIK